MKDCTIEMHNASIDQPEAIAEAVLTDLNEWGIEHKLGIAQWVELLEVLTVQLFAVLECARDELENGI